MSSTAKSFVPNVKPKSDPKEAARLQAQIGNMRKQNAQFITNEEDQKYTLERKGETDKGQAIDLKAIPPVYFTHCKRGEYVIDHRTSKILIEDCEDVTITVNGKVLTACVEVWKCKNITLKINEKIKTLQADIMTGLKIVYRNKEDFQSIVWQDVDTIDIEFLDDSNNNLSTGFNHMLSKYPDSDIKIDQFIIRFVETLGSGLQVERCVRLKNGFLSTEREAADWEDRNEKAKAGFMQKFLKEAGITLNKSGDKKVPPNKPCPCGSEKKYKKCCMNKKEITGLHETQKPVTYKPTKDVKSKAIESN